MNGYACIESNGIVVSYRMVDDEAQLEPNEVFRQTLPEPPPPSFADYVARYTPLLQDWLESVARSNAYDSVLSCVSYKDSGVAQFAGDAVAMIAWRDALWKWASEWQAGFNGQLPEKLPTLEELKAMAPQPADSGWVVHDQAKVIEARTS